MLPMNSSKESRLERQAFYDTYRKTHPEPYFAWGNLPPTERLEFELLSTANYRRIYELFQGDPNPFVLKDYKDLNDLEEYVSYQLSYSYYSPRRGGCNWLYKLKETPMYVGILNLYELSQETLADNHKKGMIGYSTSQQYLGMAIQKKRSQR